MSITGSNKPKLSGAEDFTLSIMITGYRIPSNGVYNENTTDHLVVVSNSLVTDYDLADESPVCSTPLPPIEKLTGAEPVFGLKTIKSILKSRSTFKAEYLNKFQMFVPSDSTVPKLQTAKDLQGDALLHYDAEIEVMKSDSTFHSQMNIYKLLWMLALQPRTCGKELNFVAKPGEALVSVYNRFAQLMNDLERNNMHFPIVTINTNNSMNWVNISRAKKLEKSHDPLALVAHTGSSSRNTSSYYVTHLTSVVDYDDEYQQDVFKKPILKILLASAMLLFAPSHYQISLNPIKISSSNTRRAYVQEEVVEGSNAQNETRNVQRTLRTSSSENTSTVQCYKCSGKGHDARNCPKPRIRDSKYFMEQINAYRKAEKLTIIAQKVQQQTTTPLILTSQLELYKERVWALENINGDNNHLNEFLEADRKAKHFNQQAQCQFVRDRDIIRDLEKQRDKFNLAVNDYKRKNEELQKTHLILKRKMSENEDRYHDNILDLEAKLKKNVDLILKLGNSLQGMFTLGQKPLSMYDPQLKHGLGYPNPYTLKQVISQCPKLYVASSLSNSEIRVNVRDTEDTLDDASKSQQKMKEKMNDPIAVANKQNCWTIDYKQIKALYKHFVPQKELSAEQKYFPFSFIPSDKTPNETSSIPASMP
ncbi:retrovirus-related pol polyprotein from transposon TNT 1-94, partial [Tanacetum coccineum]